MYTACELHKTRICVPFIYVVKLLPTVKYKFTDKRSQIHKYQLLWCYHGLAQGYGRSLKSDFQTNKIRSGKK